MKQTESYKHWVTYKWINDWCEWYKLTSAYMNPNDLTSVNVFAGDSLHILAKAFSLAT